jgi:hypothetical protein
MVVPLQDQKTRNAGHWRAMGIEYEGGFRKLRQISLAPRRRTSSYVVLPSQSLLDLWCVGPVGWRTRSVSSSAPPDPSHGDGVALPRDDVAAPLGGERIRVVRHDDG